MNTLRPLPAMAATLGVASLLFLLGCSRNDDGTTVVQATRPDGSSATVTVTDANVSVGVTDVWDRIKDFSYDRRADFSAGIDRMSKDMDDQTAMIREKAAGVPDAASRDRDSAMKDYDNARADLKSKRADLDHATADTWADAKEKAAASWKSTKAAYDKVTRANAAS